MRVDVLEVLECAEKAVCLPNVEVSRFGGEGREFWVWGQLGCRLLISEKTVDHLSINID